MNGIIRCLAITAVFAGMAAAQSAPARHTFEFGAAGVFPVSGWRTLDYSAGPGFRGGYEFRLIR